MIAKQQVALDQVLRAKDIHEAERLELRELRELEKHLHLVVEAQGEEGVDIDHVPHAEVVHEGQDALGHRELVLEVDRPQVKETQVDAGKVDLRRTTKERSA